MTEPQLSTDDILWLLKRPFPMEKVHWRVGNTNKRAMEREHGEGTRPTKGVALAYIDARDVMNRLDAVMGPTCWQSCHPWSDQGRLACSIGLYLSGEWIWKSDGAGATQVEEEKGAFSDAFKRAAVHWGIGRYLYALPNEWVDLNERGQIQNTPTLPDWALPNEFKSKQERDAWITALHRIWADKDGERMRAHWDDLTNEQRLDVWQAFTPTQRREIKEMLKDKAA